MWCDPQPFLLLGKGLVQCLNCNKSISLLKQNLCRSSYKKNKSPLEAYYCLLKIRKEGGFFFFRVLFSFSVAFVVVVKTLQQKSGIKKICLPPALLEGCTSCVQFPAQFGALLHHSTFFSTAAAAYHYFSVKCYIQKSTALAAGTEESSLVCCCCKKPVTPGSLLPPKPEFGRSLGNLPWFRRWDQMQGTCWAQACVHGPQLLLKPLTPA